MTSNNTPTESNKMASRQKFWFVVGEIVCGQSAYNVLDAWFKVESANGKYGCEFTKEENRTIEAYTAGGMLVAAKTWEGWHDALMTDTYGEDWKVSVERAEALAR